MKNLAFVYSISFYLFHFPIEYHVFRNNIYRNIFEGELVLVSKCFSKTILDFLDKKCLGRIYAFLRTFHQSNKLFMFHYHSKNSHT